MQIVERHHGRNLLPLAELQPTKQNGFVGGWEGTGWREVGVEKGEADKGTNGD